MPIDLSKYRCIHGVPLSEPCAECRKLQDELDSKHKGG